MENEVETQPIGDSDVVKDSGKSSPTKKSRKKNKSKNKTSVETEQSENGGIKKDTSYESHGKPNDVTGDGDAPQETRKMDAMEQEDEDDAFDLNNAAMLDSTQRNKLFFKGQELQNKDKKELALRCYLGCLKGMDRTKTFSYVSQCLHNVSVIYSELGEYDKAVQFVSAEKLYYEHALIDTTELKSKIEDSLKEDSAEIPDPLATKPESLKAIEYENLARLCLDKKQPQLALEYSAKATKLRQQVYGEDHPVTTRSLDMFTSIYAEVGKHQYSESLKKYEKHPLDGVSNQNTEARKSGGLRRRKPAASERDEQTEEDAERIHARMHQAQNEPYPWSFYLYLSPFFVMFAIAMGILFYDIYLIATKK